MSPVFTQTFLRILPRMWQRRFTPSMHCASRRPFPSMRRTCAYSWPSSLKMSSRFSSPSFLPLRRFFLPSPPFGIVALSGLPTLSRFQKIRAEPTWISGTPGVFVSEEPRGVRLDSVDDVAERRASVKGRLDRRDRVQVPSAKQGGNSRYGQVWRRFVFVGLCFGLIQLTAM